MRRFTGDDRNEQGRELIPARRDGEGVPLVPSLEGMDSDQVMSRRRMLQLTGGALAGAAVALTTGLNIGTRDAQAWWNTGCRYVYNYTDRDLYVVNQEDPWYTLYIPRGASRYFNGVIFPWCNSAYEVRTKAFVFKEWNSQGYYTSVFYMFQNYHSNEICYLREADKYNWERRIRAMAYPSSYVNVRVRKDSYGRYVPTATQVA